MRFSLEKLLPARMPRAEHESFVRAVLAAPSWIPSWLLRTASEWYLIAYAVLTAGLVLAALLGWVGVAVGLVTVLALVDWLAEAGSSRYVHTVSLAGWHGPFRMLVRTLLFTVALAMASVSLVVVAGYVVTSALIQLGWVSGVLTSGWLVQRHAPLLFVPGAPEQGRVAVDHAKAFARGSGVPGAWVALEVAATLGAGLAGGIPEALVVVAAAGIGWALGGAVRTLRLGGGRAITNTEEQVRTRLSVGDPSSVVYFSAGAGQSRYILNQWIEALEALPGGAYLIIREANQLGGIARTSLPVVYAPRTRQVEGLVLDSTWVAFYLAQGQKNVDLLREARLAHVFLNHGDSDKSTSANPVARVYDQIWVAGPAAIDRYRAAGSKVPASSFVVVGRPQVEGLSVGPLQRRYRVLLYAPTFEGYHEESNYSSLERMGPAMVRSLLERHPELTIWFKPHPSTGIIREGMRTARAEVEGLLTQAGDRHVLVDTRPGLTLEDCFNEADLLLSDVSSVVSDFLHTERPILITNPRGLSGSDFAATFPTLAAAYRVDADLAGFGDALVAALGDDPMAAERRAMKKRVQGDLPDGPTVAFVAATERAVAAAKVAAARITTDFRFTSPTLPPGS